jgi:hypothetical protein
MPIVWQTLRNLVLRAAQAPFKFIGGLVSGGGSEDLGNVSFAAGSSELSSDAQASLDKLASALKERPELRLEIEGTAAQGSDGPLIAQQRLEREYQATWYKILQRRATRCRPRLDAGGGRQRQTGNARRHLPHPPEAAAAGRMGATGP